MLSMLILNVLFFTSNLMLSHNYQIAWNFCEDKIRIFSSISLDMEEMLPTENLQWLTTFNFDYVSLLQYLSWDINHIRGSLKVSLNNSRYFCMFLFVYIYICHNN